MVDLKVNFLLVLYRVQALTASLALHPAPEALAEREQAQHDWQPEHHAGLVDVKHEEEYLVEAAARLHGCRPDRHADEEGREGQQVTDEQHSVHVLACRGPAEEDLAAEDDTVDLKARLAVSCCVHRQSGRHVSRENGLYDGQRG